jgi:hypothetical protein
LGRFGGEDAIGNQLRNIADVRSPREYYEVTETMRKKTATERSFGFAQRHSEEFDIGKSKLE